MNRSAAAREWRQYRQLSRDSMRHLLNAAVLSRGADPTQCAIWAVAVLATPPAMYAFSGIFKYTALRVRPPDVIEATVLADRMFFVLYGMLAAALLAAVTWEALFPDQTDQEVLGVLPVRPRTAAAARLTASVGVVLTLAASINVPTALLFALVATTSPVMGFLPTVAIAHITTTMGGSLFVFLALLGVRASVALLFGATSADRLAIVLQLATVIALIETFMYLPIVLPFLVRQMLEGGASALILPPVWFAAQYSWIVGSARPILAEGAIWALTALLATAALVVPLSVGPARLMARRALETPVRHRTGRVAVTGRAVSRILCLTPGVASVFEFTLASFTRSRRHIVIAATYLGLGVGVGTVALITASLRGLLSPNPQTASLSLPLVIIFFMAFGLRAAFSIPTELSANWTFRVFPPRVEQTTAAARLLAIALVVVPVAVLTMAVTSVAGWGWRDALWVGMFDALTGTLLVEWVFCGWAKVPFGAAHNPGGESIKSRWLLFVLLLNLFAFRGADLQLLALRSAAGPVVYIAATLAAIVVSRCVSRRQASRLAVAFDEPTEAGSVALNLSEALH
jgi:hypothetical protein